MNKWIQFGMGIMVVSLIAAPAFAKDKDNNPPGPMGGPGTNWENPRGPMGGPGASPNKVDFDKWIETHPELKTKLDTNADGKVDDAERKVGREQWREKKENWIEEHKEVKEKWDANKDGKIEPAERKAAKDAWKENHPYRKDFDNNPPGAKGGPGFGKNRFDNDNNPPGRRGGPGTNWENKPGPQGGPGASPNRKPRYR